MPVETFDFQRYIAEHRDPQSRASFSVSEYAFRGDVRLLRTLHNLAPVRVMMSATLRLWKGWGRRKLLKGSTRVGAQDSSRIFEIAQRGARALHMPPQMIFLAPQLRGEATLALGTEDDVFIAVQPEAVKALNDNALRFLIGRELGHVQNGHVGYQTAAYYADELAMVVVRWAASPAIVSLNSWRRRSELTADRAGLICCGELEEAKRQIIRQTLSKQRLDQDIDVEAVLRGDLSLDAEGSGWLQRLSERLPDLPLRLKALDKFSESQYFRDHIGDHSAKGATLSEVDDEVEAMLKGDVGTPSPQGHE